MPLNDGGRERAATWWDRLTFFALLDGFFCPDLRFLSSPAILKMDCPHRRADLYAMLKNRYIEREK